jgi:hypothetical protein
LVYVRTDAKLINTHLPALELAFASLPSVVTLASDRSMLDTLPIDSAYLLSYLLSSQCRLTRVRVQDNWYADSGNYQAHTHTLPDYEFSHPSHDPYFDLQGETAPIIRVFHGSPVENWHSILRRGIESKSGTKEQRNGGIFGDGVYFTDELEVARHFSKPGPTWANSCLGSRLEIVGVYDLLNSPAGVRMKRKEPSPDQQQAEKDQQIPENYYVVSDNSYVRLRSILVWRADVQHVRSLTSSPVAIASSSSPRRLQPFPDPSPSPSPSPPGADMAFGPVAVAPKSNGSYMLLFYLVLLLSIIAANWNWGASKRHVQRFFRQNNFPNWL